MDEALVSIITPMYKGAPFIGETIESVLSQSYGNWEMIIVDDCSPDDGAGIAEVKKYSKDDPRIILIESSVNKGSSGSRNTALRQDGILHFWIRTTFGILIFLRSNWNLWRPRMRHWYFHHIGGLTKIRRRRYLGRLSYPIQLIITLCSGHVQYSLLLLSMILQK